MSATASVPSTPQTTPLTTPPFSSLGNKRENRTHPDHPAFPVKYIFVTFPNLKIWKCHFFVVPLQPHLARMSLNFRCVTMALRYKVGVITYHTTTYIYYVYIP
jgi:hypothetical protein